MPIGDTQTPSLPLRHFLLALAVVAVWGSNFVVIKIALGEMPPLLFAALRFTFVLLPAVFFLPKPNVPWGNLAAYGILIGAGQFGLLFIAMRADISPGLASLVIQTQVFFTIALTLIVDKERIRPYQVLSLAVAACGIVIIAVHAGGGITFKGLALTLGAAFSWGVANLASKRAGRVNMLAYVVWSSLFSLPFLFAFAFMLEGASAIEAALRHASLVTWAAVLWQSAGNTMFGYACWAWLLQRYPAAAIAPMALLVPVFGMASSSLVLQESLPAWKLIAAGAVMSGLAVNVLWPRFRRRT